MDKREKSQGVGLLLTTVLSGVLLWALTAVICLGPVAHADAPVITTITVTSSLGTYFYNPGLGPEGGTVYFNSVGGEGAGQVLTVTVTCSGEVNTFEGDPAFGDTPPTDTSAPWQVNYTVEAGAGTQSGIVFTVTNASGSDTAIITFIQDNTDPAITSPSINEGSPYLYADGLTVYYGDDMGEDLQAFRVRGNAQDNGAGLYYVSYSAALNQGYSEDFVFLAQWRRDYTANQNNTTSGVITAIVYDRVGNSASQTFTYTRDVVNPTTYGPFAIVESSDYLHAEGTTLYYSDQMGSTPQSFTVQGNATDNVDGAGLWRATFSSAFGSNPGPDYTPAGWSGTYNGVEISDSGDGTLTVTVYDNVSNFSEEIFDYIEDTTAPTVILTSVTPPGYDENTNPLDTDESNWYNEGDFTAGGGGGWEFTSDTNDAAAGLGSGSAFWDHSTDQTDRTLDCGPDGDGTFSSVSGDADGIVAVTVTITDNVGNSASDAVLFNIDNTDPTITSPYINDYGSDYLHVDGLTVYYGDDMSAPQAFTVHGSSDDTGVGLGDVDFSVALGDDPINEGTLANWAGEYTAASWNTDSGTITVTVSDRLGNSAIQTFTYTRDVVNPTISGPFSIVESSDYLYAEGTTLYYSDQMGSTPQSFTVQGNAADNGSGLYQATFSSAFGSNPGPDPSPAEWGGTYDDVESSDSGNGTLTVKVYDNVSNFSEQEIFDYIEDTTAPTVILTSVTPPGYDENTDPLDTDGSNWYNESDFSAGGEGDGWEFTSDTNDAGAGLLDSGSGSAFWDHSTDQTDRFLNCGPEGDGTFSSVSGDADGIVAMTVTITDNVGNSASDAVLFNIDSTEPNITSPSIDDYGSPWLHVDGLTVYYGDDMSTAQPFTVQGSSNDTGVGLDRAEFSAAFGNPAPPTDTVPVTWNGSYYPDNQDWGNGTITATVYDLLDNDSYQTFHYLRDVAPPTVDVNCPALASEPSFLVSWSGSDSHSGLRHFDVQYKVGSEGSWQDWHTDISFTEDTFGPDFPVHVEDDQTYYFRVRAEDNVSNEQQYTAGNDATYVYFEVKKIFLPVLAAPGPNWGFETGDFTSWQHGGGLAQSVSTAMPHSGSYSALLGDPAYSCDGGIPLDNAWLRRSVTVPSSGSPTLSFWYRIYTQDKNVYINDPSGYDQYDFFAVYINNNLVVKDANATGDFGCSILNDLGWEQALVSLSEYKGQTIQIDFYVYNKFDEWYNTYVYIDDVSVH